MALITDLKTGKRKDKVQLFLEGEYRCTLTKVSVLTYRLKIGEELSEVRLEEILRESETQQAFDRALSLLEKYLKTEKQMKEYLLSKGFAEEAVVPAIAKLKRYGYLDDVDYASCFTENALHSKGKFRIRMELLQKGVDRTTVDEVLESTQEDAETAVKLAEKYLKNKPKDRPTKAKLYRHLSARGFSAETVSSVLRRFDWETEDFE